MEFHRYVALGDSFTEGVGDPDPARPNGLRGWADRVAEVLARQTPDFGYANLAIRGRKLHRILDEQVEPAVALAPDLVTIYAGANDILRPKVDIDALAAAYDGAIGRLAATGATVVMFTAYDPGISVIFRPVRGRMAIYNEWVREIADSHGALVVDMWRMRDAPAWAIWDDDRMHLNSFGHSHIAIATLDRLGVAHGLVEPAVPEQPRTTRAEARRQNARWVREHAVPWVHRRVTGRSSGDTVSPKRPALTPIS
ncbi:MAG TPA: SGNH/GDSL hydrolase family protein [Nocardioides sp.]|uniref:SGNH/GDSL hydrolase family protein n=1 Tax=Nocardioides sp. TaxID=35761 RepID=UPI002B74C05B|nr:SGNH/GDSL hydrolase family protein [Nocardioides sp.]HQR27612.1 SGNH/GDSL hydrolase family protein [Nocardioides sp.]